MPKAPLGRSAQASFGLPPGGGPPAGAHSAIRPDHALNKAGADPERSANSQDAHAALAKVKDAPFNFGSALAPAFFILAPVAILAVAPAQLGAVGLCPGEASIDALLDHAAFELGENSAHLEHCPARRRGGVDRLLMQIEIAAKRLKLVQEPDQVFSGWIRERRIANEINAG